MNILKMVSELTVWFVLMPLLVGLFPCHLIVKNHKRLSTIYLCGWLLMISVFQIVATFFVIKGYTLTGLALCYALIMAVLLVVSTAFALTRIVRNGIAEYIHIPDPKSLRKQDILTWILFYGILLMQLILSVIMAMPNGDDAYYVTMAVLADKTDRLFTINAYVGGTQDLHLRHALAQFSMFYAFIARMTGIHATIVAHTVMPAVLIIITYMIYGRIGYLLFNNDSTKLPVFMVLIALINTFGANSIYTSEVFFLTRTWQGKSMLANIIIPGAFAVMLMIAAETEKRKKLSKKALGLFFVLFLVNIGAAFASSLGVLLISVMELVFLICVSIRNINYRVILMALVSMIPCYAYVFIYMYNMIYYYLFQRV